MDYNETIMGFSNRHPWELSRTRCVLSDIDRYVSRIDSENNNVRFINVGAGDCYFDAELQKKYNHSLYAVDIAYPDELLEEGMSKGCGNVVSSVNNALFYRSMDDIDSAVLFDYGIMMDSLEYMDDDRRYLQELCLRIKPGGYIFITIPYNSDIYSDHDILVGNKRRYGRGEIREIIESLDKVRIVKEKRFYFSLYVYRKIQLLFGLRINPKITTGWEYKEDSCVTKMVYNVLNCDYKLFGSLGFQGLSLLLVLQKQ